MRVKQTHKILACLLAGCIMTGSARAQTAPADLTKLSLEELMNVEVTSATKREQKLSAVAAAIFVITEDTKGAVSGLSDHVNRVIEAKPDVIFAVTTALSVSAKKATSQVPVLFSWVSDPVASGLIANYSSSKNNVTGVTSHAGPLSGKRVEILKEFAPGIKQVFALVSPKEAIARDSLRYLEEAAKKLQVKVIGRDVTDPGQIAVIMADTPKGAVDAIYHVPSTLVGSHIEMLIRKGHRRQASACHSRSIYGGTRGAALLRA